MTLQSETYEITKVLKKTRAEGWKDIKVGDKISLSLDVTNNSAPGRTYQIYIDIKVRTKDNTIFFRDSMAKLHWYLSFFEMTEIR